MENTGVLSWREKLQPALDSKKREFELLGYKDISSEDIWQCLVKHIWKGNQVLPLHKVVQDILHLQAHVYMSYLSLQIFDLKNNDLAKSIEAVTHNEFNEE